MLRVLTVFGTRPEAIKMAPVVRELRARSGRVDSLVCVTGQHREMLDQVLGLFAIAPDFDLNVMRPDQSPTQVAARVLSELDPLLAVVQPDWVLVQGDTTTVMAASIAAHHRRVKVGHVEAGLRTYDRANPFPEEMNRVVADHISDLRFAPTTRARENLLGEGIPHETVFVTGNTAIDALRWMVRQPTPPDVQNLLAALQTAADSPRSLILVTAHRRESFGQPIRNICQAISLLAQRPDVHLVYPVHSNPNVWQPVHELLAGMERVTLLPPLDYQSLVHLMRHCRLILTDSGGIQEEAPSLGVPVLVMRDKTERPEAVDAGAARLVGNEPCRIVSESERLLDDPAAFAAMAQIVNPYGDGRAAERIADLLAYGHCEEFTAGPERTRSLVTAQPRLGR